MNPSLNNLLTLKKIRMLGIRRFFKIILTIHLLLMKNALDGSLKWREVCFSIPRIWFVYMVYFFIQKKYDVHAYKHLS